MLTVICGENSAESRKYFTDLMTLNRKKGNYVQLVTAKDLDNVYKENNESLTLFGQTKVYFVENLSKGISRVKDKKTIGLLKELAANKSLELYDWEEGKSQRELNIKEATIVKEFKAGKSIFQLLDACYPGNRVLFVSLLRDILENEEELFVFVMLCKHIRSLILASEGLYASTVQIWQRNKLNNLAKRWEKKKLIAFYENLFKLEIGQKTSQNMYTISESLELLSVYYL